MMSWNGVFRYGWQRGRVLQQDAQIDQTSYPPNLGGLLHPPALSLPRQTLRPGTRLFRTRPQRSGEERMLSLCAMRERCWGRVRLGTPEPGGLETRLFHHPASA